MVLGIRRALGPSFPDDGSSTIEKKWHPRRCGLLSPLPRLALDGCLHPDPGIQYP